jgi:hypothetical protein
MASVSREIDMESGLIDEFDFIFGQFQKYVDIGVLNQLCHPFSRMLGIEKAK